MRYWFDILSPKQVIFFKPVLDRLKKAGHEVLATSRRYREVEQLARLAGLDLQFVGERARGGDLYEQLEASLRRMEGLLPIVASFKPNAAVSVPSNDCARIAFGLRVRHVSVTDSAHTTVALKLGLPLSSHLITPWVIPYSAWTRFGFRREDVTRYSALDPAAWLKRGWTKRPSGVSLDSSRKTITVRLEEAYAPYMIGTDGSWPDRVLSALAREFEGYNLVALCRYQDQLDGVKKKFGGRFVVPETVVDGAALIGESDVFIGMGGTMTMEAALMGVPAISAFQGPALYAERYLVSKKLVLKAKTAKDVVRHTKSSLSEAYREAFSVRARKLLDWMEDPADVITDYLTRDVTLK